MATDLTVVAIPFYFGSMEAERRYLQQRAEEVGPSPADYTKDDTVASLTMGVASLLVPLDAHAQANPAPTYSFTTLEQNILSSKIILSI